ncbi:MAG TPA: ABC transporter permease [Candidatus Aquilonibacter sp.]|nr:ABC transporter permease [Candidatus Aquilonibacter sp.]
MTANSESRRNWIPKRIVRRCTDQICDAEIWKLAWEALISNRMRAILTILGVMIGTACVVLVVTVAMAGRRYILGQIEGVGANLIYANRVDPGTGAPPALADEISPADMAAVKAEIPNAVQVAGTRKIEMTVIANGEPYPIDLVGVTDGYQQIRKLVVDHGSYFTSDDLASQNKICLITQGLAALVFPSDDPVGQDIRIGDLHFTVIGVFHERAGLFGNSGLTGRSVIVPFPVISYYTGTDFFDTLYAQADQPSNVPAVTSEITEVLHDRHRPGAEYEAQNLAGILDTARDIAAALTILLIVISLIALVISGVGIMNIMLVTVTERTREIGIRKAIGARQDSIRFQFLVEALMISGIGAAIGVGIAIAIPAAVNFGLSFVPDLGDFNLPVSWVSVVLAFLVSFSTGVIFGYLPANRAAKLQPTESLYHE